MTPRKPPRPKPTPTLADRARELQRLAPVGSNRRRGAGVAAVLLDSGRTTAGARRLLGQHSLPPEVRTAVLQALEELTTQPGDESP
ncbi:hypothetical protein N4G69_20195 [Streptomyces mirabilis]|uniref:hypothetical protein n=1 Tax=Streptomyces mirabilis TaxID=68239 RepID=UPI0021BF4FBD|nr:hypothetical protein [Streptomyces mirabilis]MCT9107927.1 hypothetical protein [Streptomyces mirabilis]